MLWKNTQKLLKKYEEEVTKGTLLSLDPSSGSGSSFPGWAVYQAGELVASGILKVAVKDELHRKLYFIRELVGKLCKTYKPDVVILEQIESMRGFRGKSVDTLMKSVGAMMAGADCEKLVEIAPRVWKKSVDADYLKSDEADAIYIGRFAILTVSKINKDTEERWTKPRKAPSVKKPKPKVDPHVPASLSTYQKSLPPAKPRSKRSKQSKKRGTRRT